jgi:tRNA (cmo5U34)-methyltransferase
MADAKSTPDEIRARFDQDVERFSNLDTGQSATIDAPLVLDLVTAAAAAVTPAPGHVVDVGCGAGNYTLKLLQRAAPGRVTLIDLSRPMLDRAVVRIAGAAPAVAVHAVQADVRDVDLGAGQVDVILAAAVLHHLRTPAEWEAVFAGFHRALRPGGSLWVADLVTHGHPVVDRLMWARYADYLKGTGGEAYRDRVLAYVDREDSPAPLTFQLDLLRRVGFSRVEVLHKTSVFAAFGAVKD